LPGDFLNKEGISSEKKKPKPKKNKTRKIFISVKREEGKQSSSENMS